MFHSNLSRRQFLKSSVFTISSVMLSACAPGIVPADEKQVSGIGEKKQVRIMLSSWAVNEVPFDQMAQEYNVKHDDIEIKIDSSDDNTKLIAQLASGKVEWSGYGIISPFLDLITNISSGVIQPMDDLIAVSTEEGAKTLKEDMIASIRADASYEEQMYIIPYSFENVSFNWRNDMFGEVGIKTPPTTWDEWYTTVTLFKEKRADADAFPTSFVGFLWTDVGALITAATDKPYGDNGLLDWLSTGAIDALSFFRKLISEELTPFHGFDGWLESFQRGKIASLQAQSSRGVWGQNLHGKDKWTTSPIPTKKAGSGAGTVYWGNGLGVVNQSPYPQEAVDFFIYAFGPANINFQKAVIQSGKTPVFNSSYDSIIATDPSFADFQWMIHMRDDVARSIPVPRNTFYGLQNSVYRKRIVEFLDDSTISAEQCAENILNDATARIEKQKVK